MPATITTPNPYLAHRYPQYPTDFERFCALLTDAAYADAYDIAKFEFDSFLRHVAAVAELVLPRLTNQDVDDLYCKTLRAWNIARNRVTDELYERGDYTTDPETGELHFTGYPEL